MWYAGFSTANQNRALAVLNCTVRWCEIPPRAHKRRSCDGVRKFFWRSQGAMTSNFKRIDRSSTYKLNSSFPTNCPNGEIKCFIITIIWYRLTGLIYLLFVFSMVQFDHLHSRPRYQGIILVLGNYFNDYKMINYCLYMTLIQLSILIHVKACVLSRFDFKVKFVWFLSHACHVAMSCPTHSRKSNAGYLWWTSNSKHEWKTSCKKLTTWN